MRCQICNKKDATIHLTEIKDGQRLEMHICAQCASQEGIAMQSQLSINELLGNLLASAPDEEELLKATGQVSCPHCGFTLEQFRKEAVLGCPYDYEVFEKTLMPLIEQAHDGAARHCGKVPARTPSDTRASIELMGLRARLEAAIHSEDYESAAGLRDKIAEVEKAHKQQTPPEISV